MEVSVPVLDELSFSHPKEAVSLPSPKLRKFTCPPCSIKEHKGTFTSFGGFIKTPKSDT